MVLALCQWATRELRNDLGRLPMCHSQSTKLQPNTRTHAHALTQKWSIWQSAKIVSELANRKLDNLVIVVVVAILAAAIAAIAIVLTLVVDINISLMFL